MQLFKDATFNCAESTTVNNESVSWPQLERNIFTYSNPKWSGFARNGKTIFGYQKTSYYRHADYANVYRMSLFAKSVEKIKLLEFANETIFSVTFNFQRQEFGFFTRSRPPPVQHIFWTFHVESGCIKRYLADTGVRFAYLISAERQGWMLDTLERVFKIDLDQEQKMARLTPVTPLIRIGWPWGDPSLVFSKNSLIRVLYADCKVVLNYNLNASAPKWYMDHVIRKNTEGQRRTAVCCDGCENVFDMTEGSTISKLNLAKCQWDKVAIRGDWPPCLTQEEKGNVARFFGNRRNLLVYNDAEAIAIVSSEVKLLWNGPVSLQDQCMLRFWSWMKNKCPGMSDRYICQRFNVPLSVILKKEYFGETFY